MRVICTQRVTLTDTRANRVCFEAYVYDVPACRVNRESREQRTHIDHMLVLAHIRVCACAFVRGFSPVSELSDNGEQFGTRVRCGRRWAKRAVSCHIYMPLQLYDVTRGAKLRACIGLIHFILRDLLSLLDCNERVSMNLTRMAHERYTHDIC